MRIPKKVKILGQTFTVNIKEIETAGEALLGKCEININSNIDLKEETLFHEILEVIMIKLGCRFDGTNDTTDILFNFTHKQFNDMSDIFLNTLKDNNFLT